MVIPPEQLPPKQRIFDLIDLIRSKISSQEYVDLMNTAKELVEIIEDTEREEISEILDASTTGEDRIHERDIPISDDNLESIEPVPCECLSKFRYPDEFPTMDTHQTYSQMFCSGLNIFQCENFKLFCEDYPLMYNLFEKQNMPFTYRETHSSYVSLHMKMIFSIFFTLNSILDSKRHKIITTIVFYDFVIRNIQFLFDNNQLARLSYDKFVSFIVDVEFIQIADEFDINLENWRIALENAANSIIT